MEISLRHIGIIQDSTVKLDGLTVITGNNETGKTTVGKALYALVDSVSNLRERAETERNRYIADRLSEVAQSRLFRPLTTRTRHRVFQMSEQYPAMSYLADSVYDHYDLSDPKLPPEGFARKVYKELEDFQRLWEADEETIVANPMLSTVINSFKPVRSFTRKRDKNGEVISIETVYGGEEEPLIERVKKQIEVNLKVLQKLFKEIERDPYLNAYTQQSVSRSLGAEFHGQIQTLDKAVNSAAVRLSDHDMLCLEAEVRSTPAGDTVVKHTLGDMPARRAYFIDTPDVIDRGAYQEERNSAMQTHDVKLRMVLHSTEGPSVYEELVLAEELRPLKEKINEILPGSFDFSKPVAYYDHPDKGRLRLPNLAAGLKMFSILKILLEKGLLDEGTVLIMDEPEIHLHPQWQNRFAEVLILLVKELHVNILLTTHSPNLTLALDAHMREHDIQDRVNFYQARTLDNGYVTHECVNDRLYVIYNDFVKPLAEMNVLKDINSNEESGDDEEGGDDGE